MEVSITSREMVKPTSLELLLHQKPFKQSLLDQLIPTVYIPVIFFYNQPNNSRVNGAQVLDQLKQSLSKTLNRFYPLSGRAVNNLYESSYEEGVPFVETRVNGCLSDYLGQTGQETLMNDLLPCQPFAYLPNSTVPLLAIQVNIFDCGGIALALCSCHKIIDGSLLSCFLKTWAAFTRGCDGEIPDPNFDLLHASSRLFPPVESIPPSYVSFIESLWFPEGRRKTRSFVFDANSVATLMLKAKSKLGLEHPTRVAALTAFVLKHAMLASRSASGIFKPSLFGQAVNLRARMKPSIPDYSIGNLVWFSISSYDSTEKDIELHELAYLAREAVKSVESDYLDLLQGDPGHFLEVTEPIIKQVQELVSKGSAEYYGFSSWLNTLNGKGVDFGWGEPSLFTIPKVDSRKGGSGYSNAIFFKDIIGQHRAIEAWITLDEKAMAVLEQDPDFLEFASPTPY